MNSADEYAGDLKRVIEASYAYSIGIMSMSGQYSASCGLTSQASNIEDSKRRGGGVAINFVATVPPSFADTAITTCNSLDGPTLSRNAATMAIVLLIDAEVPQAASVQHAQLHSATKSESQTNQGNSGDGVVPTWIIVLFVGAGCSVCGTVPFYVLRRYRKAVKRRRATFDDMINSRTREMNRTLEMQTDFNVMRMHMDAPPSYREPVGTQQTRQRILLECVEAPPAYEAEADGVEEPPEYDVEADDAEATFVRDSLVNITMGSSVMDLDVNDDSSSPVMVGVPIKTDGEDPTC